jgi:hypothetical protein
MEVANTLVYYDKVTITAIKSLIIEAPGAIFKSIRLLRGGIMYSTFPMS